MKIRRVILLPFVIMLVLATASAEKITAEGELICTACFLGMNISGESHKKCALMCAKKGFPIAVLTQKGDLINIISIPVVFGDVIGNTVKIEGEFYERAQSLIPVKMWVKKDGKWRERELPKSGM
ncbi:MAG: hypothetical protein IIB40_11320 [Candidatus Marinimicrobia bacterium]|nr:hypothetical protein [Candidatus Neomarinimicrobiota bacterium]